MVSKVVKIILIFLGIAFVVFQSLTFELEGNIVSLLMLLLLTVLYYKWTSRFNNYFFLFLVGFTLAQLTSLMIFFSSEEKTRWYLYFVASIIYIGSYIMLIIRILSTLEFKKIIPRFLVPIIILLILDVFSVLIVSSTTKGVHSASEYVLEFIYNVIIMMLLSVALINYMYRNDNKSMLFLIGSICIVFSETIQLAYYYIIESKDLGFIYSLFLVIALLLFYLQSQLQFTGPDSVYIDDQLEEV